MSTPLARIEVGHARRATICVYLTPHRPHTSLAVHGERALARYNAVKTAVRDGLMVVTFHTLAHANNFAASSVRYGATGRARTVYLRES